jgi:hypothetical protein
MQAGDDVAFVNVRWLGHSRGAIIDTSNVLFRNTRVDRLAAPAVGGEVPLLASNAGGPQILGNNQPVYNLTVLNHTSTATGDDALALFNVRYSYLYCTLAILLLYSYCTPTALLLCSYCTHTVLILYLYPRYCTHTILILHSYYDPTLLILYTLLLHFNVRSGLVSGCHITDAFGRGIVLCSASGVRVSNNELVRNPLFSVNASSYARCLCTSNPHAGPELPQCVYPSASERPSR